MLVSEYLKTVDDSEFDVVYGPQFTERDRSLSRADVIKKFGNKMLLRSDVVLYTERKILLIDPAIQPVKHMSKSAVRKKPTASHKD